MTLRLKNSQAELELLTMDEDNEKHFNFNNRLPKKAQTEDEFQVDVKDPRFSAIYTSHHYNMDPSNPQFKANRSTQAFVAEKQRFRETGEKVNILLVILQMGIELMASLQPLVDSSKAKVSTTKSSGDVELNRLIKNVKRKAEENQQRRVKSKKM
jgi:NUC153 domain